MIIKFQILKSAVVDAVKSATYIKGRMDKVSADGADKVSYHETAGDEEIDERTLTHDFQTGIEKLKTILVDYITPTAQTIGDNVIYYENISDDIITFTLQVSRRYNGTLTDTLARHSAKYVEDWMLYQWWIKTTNSKQAEVYLSTLQTDEVEIRKCFILSAPNVPTVPYTEHITASVNGTDIDGGLTLENGDDTLLSYTIDDGALDDIEAHSDNPSIVGIHRCQEKYSFVLKPHNTGFTTVRLFSRHNDAVKFNAEVTVTEEDLDNE